MEGRRCLLVFHQITEGRITLLANRLLQGDRHLRHLENVAHFLRRHVNLRGDLLHRRLSTQALHQLTLRVDDLVELLDHVHRNADGARLVRDRSRDGLANPPRRVRRELEALAIVELLDGTDETERPLLDQIKERQAASEVALRDRHDEAQVGLDHLALSAHVALLDALRQIDLLAGGEQRHATDLTQVEAQRVEARLDGQVDLGLLALNDLLRNAALGLVQLDAVLDEIGVEILDLLFGDLDLLQRRGNLADQKEPALLADVDELT